MCIVQKQVIALLSSVRRELSSGLHDTGAVPIGFMVLRTGLGLFIREAGALY